MFPKPTELLKIREGALAETPLPLLLYALFSEERTCTLELKLRNLEKKILIEDGAPVGCQSNLLHETLGKYLVERGKLEEARYQDCLVESVQTGMRMGELLVKKQLIAPFELYKQMQANLAHKILDCFRWGEAKWRIVGEVPANDSPVRMNPLQLILTGTSTFLPFEVVATHLTFVDEQRFTVVPRPRHEVSQLKLPPKDARFLQVARSSPTFAEITSKTGLETEDALRKLFAFCVIGLIDFAEAVAAQPAPEPSPPPAPEPVAPAAPSGIAFSDDDDPLREELVAAFLAHRARDPFELLGVDESAAPSVLRKSLLEALEKFAPLRFRTGELREKAEALTVAYAKAFGTLSDPDMLALARKRRAIAREKQSTRPRVSTAEQFRIRTDLLDAKSQFEEGQRRLSSGNPRGALEYFQYAADIEPKSSYRAHLAWARFLVNPDAHARLALQELGEVVRSDPASEIAFAFMAQIQKAQGQFAVAEESYKAAFKLNPKQRSYADEAHEMARLSKKK